mmetsp:Transcript_31417/g.75972  ORF Transcript_31417/g.75972 Transcript_31417/m.75972 type:complete len:243 (+) Transcript_31417:224-952(+)
MHASHLPFSIAEQFFENSSAPQSTLGEHSAHTVSSVPLHGTVANCSSGQTVHSLQFRFVLASWLQTVSTYSRAEHSAPQLNGTCLPSAPHGVPLSPPCISPPTLCTHGVPLRPQAALVPSIPVLTTAPRVFPSQPPQQLVPWIPVPPPAPREFHSARSFDPRLLHPDHRTQGAPVRPKLSPKSQVIPTSDHPSVPKLLAQFVPMPTSRTQARPLPPSHCPCRTASTLLTQLQSPDKMYGSAG